MSNVNINNLARLLQELLHENIEELARETNFIRCRRVLCGFDFFLTMMMNCLGFRPITLFGLQQDIQEHGLEITESGLWQRFTQSCVDFLKAVLGDLCQKLITLDVSPEVLPLTSRFPPIYVNDCTEVSIPSDLADDLPSCGSSPSVASGKKIASVKAFAVLMFFVERSPSSLLVPVNPPILNCKPRFPML
jgi:hypothetical protein